MDGVYQHSALSSDGGQCIALRASLGIAVALAMFVLASVAAVYSAIAPMMGRLHTGAAAMLLMMGLTIAARSAYRRYQPAMICLLDNGWLAAFDQRGARLSAGRIASYAQWSDVLLVLDVIELNGRTRSLLVPNDAVDKKTFRALAVLGRYAVRLNRMR